MVMGILVMTVTRVVTVVTVVMKVMMKVKVVAAVHRTLTVQRGQLSQLLWDSKMDMNPGSAELPREAGDQRAFSAEGQTVPIFRFVDHAISMAVTQLCRYSIKATRHST